MKRRDFGKVLTIGTIGVSAERSEIAHAKPAKALMHVGCQSGGTTASNLLFKKRHGVNNIDGGSPKYTRGVGWSESEVSQMKNACESYGISLDMLHTPLGSGGNDNNAMPNILLGKSPERDVEIVDWWQIIEVASKVGIRGLNYNLTILPVIRTASTAGRGGSTYSSFDYTLVNKDYPLTSAGVVPLDVFWERITYFLERVIPVAEEHKVQMACHIPDPPLPPGFRGVDRWNYPVFEGLKRFVEIAESPYHGFNFCVGSAAEGLENIDDIYDIVRYFGERKKIFNVHFRNIKGGLGNFQEVYPDNGDIDFYRLMKVFRDVEYPYMLMPDHVPSHSASGSSNQAFAGCYFYIKGLIQAVNSGI